MSSSFDMHLSLSPIQASKKRSPLFNRPQHPDATPIPPTLVNSPHLASSHSVFRRESSVRIWPSQEDDEWLRDMVPLDRSSASDGDTKSEASNDSTPSPTSSDSSFGYFLLPPSPLLRPRSTGADAPTSTKRALCGSGSGQSPHS
ncbi:hypothetical protein J3R82DRAFT_5593 [Butyriboletus roseoflavus]|nr:hypothetical protein J3R82DRAFT_5593 [Butyriboletus roseoflavus]